MMKRYLTLGFFLAISTIAWGVNKAPTLSPAKELQAISETLNNLHSANMFEIEAARMALLKSQGKDVHAYASHLIHDHQVADRKVAKVAKSVVIPVTQLMLQEQKDVLTSLKNVDRGTDFDQAFIAAQIDAHQKAVSMVQSAQAEIQNHEVSSLLDELLPKLQGHLTHAQHIADRLTGNKRVPAGHN